jgi:hypothetical protein
MVEQRSRSEYHISFLLSIRFYTFLTKKQKEVTRTNFKAVFLLCLLLFTSISMIAIASFGTITSGLKKATLASGLGGVQPCGGDPIDDPTPT